MTTTAQDASNFESSLRDRLIAAQNGPITLDDQAQTQEHESHIDPSIEGQLGPPDGPGQSDDYAMGGIMDEDLQGDVDGQSKNGQGRRELSTTKRAAQNRAAQRAFRQRKEAYITKLEKQVKDFRVMDEDLRVLQHENYQLREYVLVLQSRILESSADLPPPPPQIHIPHPSEANGLQHTQIQHDQPPHPQTDPLLGSAAEQEHNEQVPIAAMLSDPEQQIDDAIPREVIQQLRAAAAEAGDLEETDITDRPDVVDEK